MKIRYTIIFTVFLIVSNVFSGEILNVPNDYPTLQDAVNQASPGDTIVLEEGDYYGFTVVTKSLSIVGAGKDKTVLYYTDKTSSQGLSPGVMNFALIAKPVLKIDTMGKVSVRDLEIRGAREGFLHFGTTPFGIISNNSDLNLINVRFRRLRNIAVWANRGTLNAVDVDFADDMGFRYQADLGFHLTNLTKAYFLRFSQVQGNIDHSININDYPEGDMEETRTEVTVENSTIAASALFWGDCIRSYGSSDIRVINSSFYRNPGGEAPRNLGNTGISLNGGKNSIYISGSSFRNMVEGIRLMTLPRDDQFYRVTIENSIFDTFDIAPIIITGKGRVELDLGGGSLGSVGNNSFNPEGVEIVLNEDSADVHISYPEEENLNTVNVVTEIKENQLFLTESAIEVINDGNILYKTDLTGIKPIKALFSDSFIIASYSYKNGSQFLGVFTKELDFISAYNMGSLDIIDFTSNGSVILSHYKNKAGLHYIGTFSLSLEFLGDYWFYSNVKVIDSYLENDQVKVLYDYGEGAVYVGVFNYQMEYIEEHAVNQ